MATVVSAEVERTRRLIDGLRRDRRAHPYHGRREYSQRAREVAEACAALIEVEPAAVPALTRRAVDLVTTALMYMDDSSGIVGDDLHELMRLHAQACCTAPPDPKRLAAWLAKIRLDGPGWPDFELRDFAPALSERGRTELARIVEERARTTEPDVFGGTPFRIRALREQLAEISGDLDHYIAVLAQDLRTARQYLKIIQVLRGAGHAAEAENWAYRGLAGLGNPIDMDKLRDAYVDLLLERGANDDAIILSQKLFATQPTQTNYLHYAAPPNALETGKASAIRPSDACAPPCTRTPPTPTTSSASSSTRPNWTPPGRSPPTSRTRYSNHACSSSSISANAPTRRT